MKIQKLLTVIRTAFLTQRSRAIGVLITGSNVWLQLATARFFARSLETLGIQCFVVPEETEDNYPPTVSVNNVYVFTSQFAQRVRDDSAIFVVDVHISWVPAWIIKIVNFFNGLRTSISKNELNDLGISETTAVSPALSTPASN